MSMYWGIGYIVLQNDFPMNSVKNEPIVITFDDWNPEEIRHKQLCIQDSESSTYLRTVTRTPPGEMHNLFI